MEKQNRKPKVSGVISQLIGLAIVASGILTELIFRGHIGFVAITGGAIIWAAGAWIKTK